MNCFVILTILLLWATNEVESKEKNCYSIDTLPTEMRLYNLTTYRKDVHYGDIKHYLLDSNGNVLVSSNSNKSRLCVDDDKECHFLFLSGNGFFNITTYDDDSDEVGSLIAEGEVLYDEPKLLQMGECVHYCGDQYQLTFVGEADNAPTLYYRNTDIIEQGLFHKNISNGTENERNIVMETMCIHPSECYRLTGSALYVLSNGNTTTVEEGNTYHGYKTIGDDPNCLHRCDAKPLLARTQRGQEILLAITSISGAESIRNVHSPQYKAACWLIYDDARQLGALDYNLIQRYILAVVYFSLNGAGWSRNYDFLTANHECRWNRWVHNRLYNGELYIYELIFNVGDSDGDGTHCDTSGRVTGLVLDGNNLEGTMPFEVSFLTHAEYLKFFDNIISGPLMSQLGTMQKLRIINFENNLLTGSIPETLGDITTLQVIDLNGNGLTGTFPRSFRGDLKVVSLTGNLLSGTISNEIGMWTSLRIFSGLENHLSGTIPEGIGNLSFMEEFFVGYNGLTGSIPSNFLTLPNLRRAWLNDNKLTGTIPNQIAHGGPMCDLYLDYNDLTGTIPSEISRLSNLEYLWVSNNNLSGEVPQTLQNLTYLFELFLERNNITGNVPFVNCSAAPLYMEADCDTPQKVSCPCCSACHGIFTFHDDELECSSGQLTMTLDNLDPGHNVVLYLDTAAGSLIDYEEKTVESTSYRFSKCIAMSGCFRIIYINTDLKAFEMELVVNNHTVLQELITEGEGEPQFYFGWSSNGLIEKDTCDDFTLCNSVAEANSTKRDLIDKLTRITGIEVFDDESSTYHRAACRFVSFIDYKDDVALAFTEMIQHFYLSLLYFETGGEEWTNSTLWATSAPFCDWFGVRCDSYGVVTSITLPSNNLLGTIPSEIAELRGLEQVLLNDNNLYGTLPLAIGVNLVLLEEFNLSNNRIWGSLPTEFSRMVNLKTIDISQNQLSGSIPADVGMMVNAESFNFFQNTLSGELPESFYELTGLKVLNLGSNLLYGDASGVKNFADLEFLDLNSNFFTGTIPLGTSQEKLRLLRLSGNRFRGSIPASVELLSSLEELFLYNNQLTGNLPSQVGNLQNLRQVSISYNGIRGSLPSEIGRLKNLTLLHLHNNEIEGKGDFFEYTIQDYVTDCGNTFTAPARVECTSCTGCCNVDGDCLRKNITWPGEVIEGAVLPPAAMVFLFTVASCLVLAGCIFILQLFCKKKDFKFCQKFQEKSVYKLVLSNSPVGKFLVFVTVALQSILLYIFVAASDFTSVRNDWEFSTSCPLDSIYCDDKRHITILAWFAFGCVIFAFLFKDMYEGCKMLYDSYVLTSLKSFVAGLTVAFITLAAVETSVLYLYSTGISSTDILKDAVILVFLNEIDEQLYSLLEVMLPSWLEKQNEDISTYLGNRILAMTVREKSEVDPENQRSAERESNNEIKEMAVFGSTMFEFSQRGEGENLSTTRGEEMDVVGEDHIKNLEGKIVILENEVSALHDDNDKLREEICEIKKLNEIGAHNMEITELKNDLKRMQNEHEKSLIDIVATKNDNANLMKEICEIKKLLQMHETSASE